jgi:hypothetical protein
MIDDVADSLERSRHYAIAAVLDSVSEELEQRGRHRYGQDEDEDEEFACANGTCADGSCADAEGQCRDGSTAVVAAYGFDTTPDCVTTTPRVSFDLADPTKLLTGSAQKLFDAVKQYGAKAYAVDGRGVEIGIDRGEVETTAAFQFCSQDEAGKPQLRITFESGGNKMVRWASLDSFDDESLAKAVVHVFSTGDHYGSNVVTASTASSNVNLELVDRIEQAIHDSYCAGHGIAVAARKIPRAKLRLALPSLDAWTAGLVKRYLAGKLN